MSIRSGRFFHNNTDAAGSYTIIEVASNRGSTVVYRLLNSGGVTFKLDVGNGDRELDPGQSIDVAIGKKGALSVSWEKPAEVEDVRLSYNYLAEDEGVSLESIGEIRSGRFAGDATKKNNVIVDLGSAGSAAYYRIFNAGSDDVELAVGGHGDITVPPKFSKDVLVTNGNPGKSLLVLKEADDVDVIYDLLGGVE